MQLLPCVNYHEWGKGNTKQPWIFLFMFNVSFNPPPFLYFEMGALCEYASRRQEGGNTSMHAESLMQKELS